MREQKATVQQISHQTVEERFPHLCASLNQSKTTVLKCAKIQLVLVASTAV